MAMTRNEIIKALATVISESTDAMPAGAFEWSPLEDIYTVPMSDGKTVNVRGEAVNLFSAKADGDAK